MSKLWKRVIAVAALLLVATALVWALRGRPVPVDLEPVVRGTVELDVEATGKTKVRDSVSVVAPVSGQLHRIRLEAGDRVEAGQTVLAVLTPVDSPLLDARSKAAAEARLQAAKAGLDSAKDRARRARAAYDFAKTEERRAQRLLKGDATTRQDADSKRYAAKTAMAEWNEANANLRAANAQVEAASAELQPPSAQAPQREITLKAPVDGRVLTVYEEQAKPVAAGTPLLEVGDLKNLEAVVDVLSRDAVRIRPGDAVRFDAWGGEERLHGRVRSVDPSAKTKVSALGVEEQRVDVHVDLEASPQLAQQLGAGYGLDASIQTDQRRDVITVPASALVRGTNTWMVYVADAGRASLRPVVIGANNGVAAEVLRGLKVGERVLTYPSDQIADGRRIEARPSVSLAH